MIDHPAWNNAPSRNTKPAINATHQNVDTNFCSLMKRMVEKVSETINGS